MTDKWVGVVIIAPSFRLGKKEKQEKKDSDGLYPITNRFANNAG